MCIRGRRACFAWPLAGGAAGHAGGRKHDDLLLRPEGHSQLRHQGVRPPRTQIAVPPPVTFFCPPKVGSRFMDLPCCKPCKVLSETTSIYATAQETLGLRVFMVEHLFLVHFFWQR